jgi:hypothetical protein
MSEPALAHNTDSWFLCRAVWMAGHATEGAIRDLGRNDSLNMLTAPAEEGDEDMRRDFAVNPWDAVDANLVVWEMAQGETLMRGQIIRATAEGYKPREIAPALGIGEEGVRWHRREIKKGLQVAGI